MSLLSWQSIVPDGSIRALKYSFGVGLANTLAVKLDDGWLVVSPCTNPPAEVLEALAQHGPVRALVAPNAFHHMGQAAWRARFPEAVSYAPAGALPRLKKKAQAIPFHPLDELAPKLPKRVSLFMPEGLKAPDLMLHATSGGGTVWFSGDLISNTASSDMPLPARLLFGLLGGGPGYRVNGAPAIVYVADRKRWKESVRAAFEAAPPTVVVPAHGDPVSEDAMAKSRAILA